MTSHIEQGIYKTQIAARHKTGARTRLFYLSAILIAFLVLIVLFVNILHQAAGLVLIDYEIPPEQVSSVPLEELSNQELSDILLEYAPRRILVLIRDNLSAVPPEEFTSVTVSEAVNGTLPEGTTDLKITELTPEQHAETLALNLSQGEMIELINTEVLATITLRSWNFFPSVFERDSIERWIEDNYPITEHPNAELQWRTWLDLSFLTSPLNSTPALTGIMPGILGTFYLMIIVIAVAFPVGVGAAIYLEEYASDGWFSGLIEVNIRNLAGVPSIIYGMLGLSVFVNFLANFTGGRSLISGGLTLALLILPIIIVSSQEALRSVSRSIHEGSYGLGATKWQTISRQILPIALPGILTGTILGVSRAIGETAPLVVVGAAVFINTNPEGLTSRFTTLPNLIYYWTSQPDDQFRNVASAAIIVLLLMLLTMNSVAIYIRNRASTAR